MFRFDNRQVVCDIAGVKIGGQPGVNPTALAGTMFYEGHKIVGNAAEGQFDKKKAGELIESMKKAGEESHVPGLLQLFFQNETAGKKYVDFAIGEGNWNGPIVIDCVKPVDRAKIAGYCTEIGIADRTIYNSINSASEESELELLADAEVYSTILLAFNALNGRVEGTTELLENGGKVAKKGLLKVCEEIGMKNILIDPGAIPFGQKSQFLRSLIVLKAKYGYPVGCGIHNVPSAWKWLKKKDYRHACDIASNALAIGYCSDFVLFGPIENAPEVFPIAAMCDIISAEQSGAKVSKEHPANFLV